MGYLSRLLRRGLSRREWARYAGLFTRRWRCQRP
ncbi:MAG: hypothetical protein LBF87_09450 [Treponema sp.]|nr:hypothetical protein [Treponema sp.]